MSANWISGALHCMMASRTELFRKKHVWLYGCMEVNPGHGKKSMQAK